jgi:hypothetical protein
MCGFGSFDDFGLGFKVWKDEDLGIMLFSRHTKN